MVCCQAVEDLQISHLAENSMNTLPYSSHSHISVIIDMRLIILWALLFVARLVWGNVEHILHIFEQKCVEPSTSTWCSLRFKTLIFQAPLLPIIYRKFLDYPLNRIKRELPFLKTDDPDEFKLWWIYTVCEVDEPLKQSEKRGRLM